MSVITIMMSTTVRRTIHQIWFNLGDEPHVPAELHERQQSWKRLRLDFSYKLWDLQEADRIIESCDKTIRDVWSKLPHGINKADFFRYVLLFRFGGFYVDLDFQNVDGDGFVNFFDNIDGVVLSEEWPFSLQTGSVHNGVLFSPRAGHPFWSFVFRAIHERLNALKAVDFRDKQKSVFDLTGTAMLRNIAVDYWQQNLSRTFPLVVVPFGMFCPLLSRSGDETYYIDSYDFDYEAFPPSSWTLPSSIMKPRPFTFAMLLPAKKRWQKQFF